MTRAFRRDLFYAAGFLVCLAGYGLAPPGLPWARWVFALAAFAVVVAHVLLSDEVVRAVALRAGAAAFALAAAGALLVTVLGEAGWLAGHADRLWAVLFALYLVCWSVLRLALR
jgi:hypothetical protein